MTLDEKVTLQQGSCYMYLKILFNFLLITHNFLEGGGEGGGTAQIS